jgi:hypothetical protein
MICRVTLDTWIPRLNLCRLAIATRHVPDTCMGTRETTEDGSRQSSKAGSDHLLVNTLRSDMGFVLCQGDWQRCWYQFVIGLEPDIVTEPALTEHVLWPAEVKDIREIVQIVPVINHRTYQLPHCN